MTKQVSSRNVEERVCSLVRCSQHHWCDPERVVWTPTWGFQRLLLRSLWSQNFLYFDTGKLFGILTHSLSFAQALSKDNVVWCYHNRLNAEAGRRIHLSLLWVRDVPGCGSQCHSSHWMLVLEKRFSFENVCMYSFPITAIMTKNIHFLKNSGGQSPEKGFTKLQSRCLQACIPSWGH